VIDDFDARLRREAQAWLTVRTHDGQVPINSDELLEFEIDGRPFKLMDRQRGIRKPRELTAALSIRTVYTIEGGSRPYEDAVGPGGLLRYKWRGDIRPDLVVEIRPREIAHGASCGSGRAADPELLEHRYALFRTAG
jgi:hypothetical protein